MNDAFLQTSGPFTSTEIIEAGTIEPKGELRIPEETATIERFGFLHIFLLDKDTLLNVPWERIVDEDLVLEKYDLSLEDLESMNRTIEYQ